MSKPVYRRNLIRFALLMTMTFCALTSSRAQDCKVVETLPNDEFIVECDGKKHRTISPAHIKEIQEKNAVLASQTTQIDLLNQKVKLLLDRDALRDEERSIAAQKLDLEKQRTALYKEMFDVVSTRLKQSEQITKDGRAKKFFASIWFDLAKITISVATLVLAK